MHITNDMLPSLNMVPTAARGRNCTFLAEKNEFPFDRFIDFDEVSHTYRVNGELAPLSVSAALKKVSPPEGAFNGPLIIKKSLASWRVNQDHYLHSVVHGLGDKDAEAAVLRIWKMQTNLGTAAHLAAERLMNSVDDPVTGVETETEQIRAFLKEHDYLAPLRTELSVYATRDGKPTIAGQLDALFEDLRDTTGHTLTLVDFKRTDKEIDSGGPSYGKKMTGELAGRPANLHTKYSMQTHLYACLLSDLLEPGFQIECALVKLHPSLNSYQYIPCADLRAEASALISRLSNGLTDQMLERGLVQKKRVREGEEDE